MKDKTAVWNHFVIEKSGEINRSHCRDIGLSQYNNLERPEKEINYWCAEQQILNGLAKDIVSSWCRWRHHQPPQGKFEGITIHPMKKSERRKIEVRPQDAKLSLAGRIRRPDLTLQRSTETKFYGLMRPRLISTKVAVVVLVGAPVLKFELHHMMHSVLTMGLVYCTSL